MSFLVDFYELMSSVGWINLGTILLIIILVIYFVISILLFMMLTINVNYFFMDHDYDITPRLEKAVNEGKVSSCYHVELKKTPKPEVHYWKISCEGNSRTAIIMHGWGDDSSQMFKQALFYLARNFNVIMVDARSHGRTRFYLLSTAYLYAEDVQRIMEIEGIQRADVVHGLSFGAIAASILARNHVPRYLILEAVSYTIKDIFYDMLSYIHVPIWLYGWVPRLVISLVPFDLDEYAPIRTVERLDIPVMILHGSNDRLFKPEKHHQRFVELSRKKKNVTCVLIQGAKHSNSIKHPGYEEALEKFISVEITSK